VKASSTSPFVKPSETKAISGLGRWWTKNPAQGSPTNSLRAMNRGNILSLLAVMKKW
jgi:hypothetical protein